jgi:hypothetical protein
LLDDEQKGNSVHKAGHDGLGHVFDQVSGAQGAEYNLAQTCDNNADRGQPDKDFGLPAPRINRPAGLAAICLAIL